VKYRFIKDNLKYPVAKWARMLKIQRTGYYVWLRKREALEEREAHLKKRIKEVFDESRGTYGPDRITAELRKKCEHLGRKRCAEYMADMNLSSCHNKHRAKSLTNSKRARGEVLVQRVQQSWIKQVGESPTSVTASGLSSESRCVAVMWGAKREDKVRKGKR